MHCDLSLHVSLALRGGSEEKRNEAREDWREEEMALTTPLVHLLCKCYLYLSMWFVK